ncbi:hypothetical protein HDV01_000919 [Terramyces sp. JEL0728]|nr:hypothetical protein HDV01_000919 [Terramyces sp. JEL0728]
MRKRTALYFITVFIIFSIYYVYQQNEYQYIPQATDAQTETLLENESPKFVQNNYGRVYNSSNQCMPRHPNRFGDFVKERTLFWKSTTPELEKEINTRLFKYIREINTKTVPKYRGTGIVMSVYSNVADMALNSLTFLYKQLHSNLSCEIFYQNLAPYYTEKFKELGCSVKKFRTDRLLYNPSKKRTDTNTYWKIVAILSSDFENVLFLDCDNFPLREPSFLFNTGAYRDTGMILWPDFWTQTGENPLWRILGLECIDEKEHESGQVVVNKNLLYHQLQLSLYLSMSPDFAKYTHGDKEAFSLAMRLYNSPYHQIKQNTFVVGTEKDGFCGMGMLQFYDTPLFMHVNFLKYNRRRGYRLDRALEMLDDSVLQIGGCLTAKNGGKILDVGKEWTFFSEKLVDAYINL